MRKLKAKSVLLLMLAYICLFSVCQVYALDQRKIYVGDIINIKISSSTYTEEEIRKKFKDFEIVHFKKEDDAYLIGLRTFETGKKNIKLGDKEIELVVYSTLEGKEDRGLIDGDSSYEKLGINRIYGYFLYTTLAIFLFSSTFYVISLIRGKSKTELTASGVFWNSLKKANLQDEESLAFMKSIFKRYMEEVYSCSINGKTSWEIVREIKEVEGLKEHMQQIKQWFEKCDRYTFSPIISTAEEKQKLFNELEELVENMEDIKEGEGI
ncbi:hypothetical protein [Oceanirhabdus sp. W0125-5]|uniref:hypothetical protein n=1 Tax=Oceanirhabdus sp. W0125-5 TaxID=2999116 RepID=UPI0022F3262C|nr:hypothetical protein [Oceanirhabdus sp. W0125-5]WBW98252.1 hypothetical protein OW730_05650 [Oceanirhabdus sp. W0125-5]